MIDISDGICGYVAGGLGNQLFIMAAAWEQAHRLKVPLYLDSSHYPAAQFRSYGLSNFDSPAIHLKEHGPWTSLRLPGGRTLPFPRKFNPIRQRLYFEKSISNYSPEIDSLNPGTTMFGYFQSPHYFRNIESQLNKALTEAPLSLIEQEAIAMSAADPRITLHLRRGDFLALKANTQVITSVNYAKNAIESITRLGIPPKVRVFTDSPELVLEELKELDMDIQLIKDPELYSPLATMRIMSEGTAMVMSNSSFSWWAAWLMQQKKQPHTAIVAPRPWTADGNSRSDLLEKTWLTLDAR